MSGAVHCFAFLFLFRKKFVFGAENLVRNSFLIRLLRYLRDVTVFTFLRREAETLFSDFSCNLTVVSCSWSLFSFSARLCNSSLKTRDVSEKKREKCNQKLVQPSHIQVQSTSSLPSPKFLIKEKNQQFLSYLIEINWCSILFK